MSTYRIARIDEIDEVDESRSPMRPVRHHLGIRAFGVNAFGPRTAGERLINEHDEADDGQEELYVVLSGRARFELDGENRDAPQGTLVFVAAGVTRTAFAEEDGTTLLAVGAQPGKPYVVGGWEAWLPLQPLFAEGRYAEVADAAAAVLAEDPDLPAVLYNTACAESLAGRREDAIAHLRRAIELWEDCRNLARDDSDFDPIRDDPAFSELVSSEARSDGAG